MCEKFKAGIIVVGSSFIFVCLTFVYDIMMVVMGMVVRYVDVMTCTSIYAVSISLCLRSSCEFDYHPVVER